MNRITILKTEDFCTLSIAPNENVSTKKKDKTVLPNQARVGWGWPDNVGK